MPHIEHGPHEIQPEASSVQEFHPIRYVTTDPDIEYDIESRNFEHCRGILYPLYVAIGKAIHAREVLLDEGEEGYFATSDTRVGVVTATGISYLPKPYSEEETAELWKTMSKSSSILFVAFAIGNTAVPDAVTCMGVQILLPFARYPHLEKSPIHNPHDLVISDWLEEGKRYIDELEDAQVFRYNFTDQPDMILLVPSTDLFVPGSELRDMAEGLSQPIFERLAHKMANPDVVEEDEEEDDER